MLDCADVDRAHFKTHGSFVKRGIIPSNHLSQAQALIRRWCEERMQLDALDQYTQTTFAPELGADPALLGLYHETAITRVVADLLHPDEAAPVTKVQIQIRLPEATLGGVRQPEKSFHVDGVGCPHLLPTELRTFSLLVGILLSDVSELRSGALQFVPGGHYSMAEWFRDEWAVGEPREVPETIAQAPPTSFVGRAGDAVFLHHLIPHRVGKNYSSDLRVMAYFRVQNTKHSERKVDALKDPWLDFPSFK